MRASRRIDRRPPRDVDIHVPSRDYVDRILGEQELVDRCPAEIKAVFWERGFHHGLQAYRVWKRARMQARRSRV